MFPATARRPPAKAEKLPGARPPPSWHDSLAEGSTSDNPANIIGVLDIFGFESFETGNSFEQLCINFCNEKLQFHFNEHIFRLEQEVYAAEGVDVPRTDFKDNQPTLDLLEKKSEGIFAMIDEEMKLPGGNDEGYLRKVLAAHAGKDVSTQLKKTHIKAKDECHIDPC